MADYTAAKRKITPGPEGVRLLALGGVPGALYSPHPATELGGPESFAGYVRLGRYATSAAQSPYSDR